MANPVTLLDASNNVIGTFATIQAAVNAASNGDTVQIAAGTYQEQVTVNGLTNLTIEGAGQGQTIIQSPDYTNLVSNIQNPGEFHTSTDALVGVENGASVTVKNLTVDGNNQGVIYAVGANGGGDLVGIEAVNSSLNVSNVHVTGTEDVEGGCPARWPGQQGSHRQRYQ
jgi:pectin methylesterase-like acyl-CoA thioesterase